MPQNKHFRIRRSKEFPESTHENNGGFSMANKNKVTAPIAESIVIKKGEPIKNMLNADSLYDSGLVIKSVYEPFPVDEFVKSTIDESWDGLELKARGRQVTINLKKYLPECYGECIAIFDKVVDAYTSGLFVLGMSFNDFVEVYGQDDKNWDMSIKALAKYTTLWSAEGAVRPFIIGNEERMMAQMLAWSKHENEHIRRLASEGCRPALPWAMALPKFKKDPTPILPILEQLKADSSQYVRKSVANNLNDISKTCPDVVIKIAVDWYGEKEHTNWIVKHGCRTLLKKGNREILALFGLDDTENIEVDSFVLETAAVPIGGNINFSFNILAKEATKARLEYGIDYVKANSKKSRKIFKLSEVSLRANEKKTYTRKHSFEDLSTRKHYPGVHGVTLIVNGAEQVTLDFELV
jgi:3-methyladenine DNA glycosylase AlkC